ncbi:hypothetical protein [Plantactinospora sp. DSM 117369]
MAVGQASLSRIPVDGSHLRHCSGLVLFGLGLGSAFVAATVLAVAGSSRIPLDRRPRYHR